MRVTLSSPYVINVVCGDDSNGEIHDCRALFQTTKFALRSAEMAIAELGHYDNVGVAELEHGACGYLVFFLKDELNQTEALEVATTQIETAFLT